MPPFAIWLHNLLACQQHSAMTVNTITVENAYAFEFEHWAHITILDVRKDGIYIELGACDGILFSNTLFFEKELKFHGILIEPVGKFFSKLLQNRYYNLCYNCAISTEKEDTEILVNGMVGGFVALTRSGSKYKF